MNHHDLQLALRIATAFGLCFMIGFERELRGAAAGDRTYALVGTGAAGDDRGHLRRRPTGDLRGDHRHRLPSAPA